MRIATLIALSLAPAATTAAEPAVVALWPAKAPGESGDIGPEKAAPQKSGDGRPITIVSNVTVPTLTVYPGDKDKATGAAVVVAPGGGYNILAWDLEGTEVAEWLNRLGVTAFVLKYRVPRRPDAKEGPPPQPLMDAQRALSLVRSKAKDYGVDPAKVGMLGFSAGGHLTAAAATAEKRTYEAIDEADKLGCKPDFVVLVYPAYLTPKDKVELVPALKVTKETPPTFLAHSADDGVSPDNSVAYFLALKKAGAKGELHVYASGGHGFGLRKTDKHDAWTWPDRCADWLKRTTK